MAPALTHHRMLITWATFLLITHTATSHGHAATPLPEIVVLAQRQTDSNNPRPTTQWSSQELTKAAPRTLDELLATDPSFSLYRRQTALFGNPTAAGVSLRNTGATATSRSLVLLDGIPQNDPFGGWIYWTRYDPSTLESIRITPAAQAAVWGNQSPSGIIQLTSKDPFQTNHTLRANAGGQGTYGASTSHQISNPQQTTAFSISTFGLHSDGFFTLDSSQRGPIDRRLDLDLSGINLKAAFQTHPGIVIEPMLSFYQEERGNGTPLARNATDALDLALRLTLDQGPHSWQALLYHQRREFSSTFSTVSPDRTSEILALNQFDVPGRGTGGAITWNQEISQHLSLTAGTDARFLTGATHENVGTFRQREAGGAQSLVGIYAAAAHHLSTHTRIDANLRLDTWQLTHGRRIETSLTTGSTLRDEHFKNRSGLEPSASLEFNHQFLPTLTATLSLGSGFRLPTLNELHRPFRVRNDIVEANPQLDPERFTSLESTLTWTPSPQWEITSTLFHHTISDPIANVPLTTPSDISEVVGTIPPGGSASQRRNLDEAQVTGLQTEINWLPHPTLTLGLASIWMNTEFTHTPTQPLLEGKPFPQAPDLRLILDASWQATHNLELSAAYQYGASQFDDPLATRTLPSYTTLSLATTYTRLNATYQLRIDNLLDEPIQTALSSNGIRSYAAPRSLWLSAEWQF